MNILAIESSCDETSVAVLIDSEVRSNVISSQLFHNKFGGVVPELASRAHIRHISSIMSESLIQAGKTIADIEALAVTSEPGLVGSLIVGSSFAKGLSLRYRLPIVPVNHIEGHLYSGKLENQSLEFPFISLVVSGGHTALFLVFSFNSYKILGLTRDDAAGEAFDKIATLLGLGYPGGPEIERLALSGNKNKYNFPRGMINSENSDFSFSGLKTSVRYFLNNNYKAGIPGELLPDMAASAQAAIVEVLVSKTIAAAKSNAVGDIVISGGVSANLTLRQDMVKAASLHGIKVTAPQMTYCMDNAAMIGYIAEKKLIEGGSESFTDLSFIVNPTALRSKYREK
ncbi:MAG: tRNA N6-adenosine threonylcarbamoyltransferase [Bacteroidota bacterium]|nr:tRNA N6-adenosine threonylcarbamoyltransferase [Bacteroidota bacterium]